MIVLYIYIVVAVLVFSIAVGRMGYNGQGIDRMGEAYLMALLWPLALLAYIAYHVGKRMDED